MIIPISGAGIYNTSYYVIILDNVLALNMEIHTIKIAISNALGTLFVFSLSQWLIN